MTIKVEREALVTVLSQAPLLHASRCEGPSISSSGDYVLVDFNSKSPCLNADVVLCSTYSDEDSLCTLSTSSDSLSSDASIDKRVTFSSSLVTDEWTRPFTPRDEVAKLFYSTEDTNRYVLNSRPSVVHGRQILDCSHTAFSFQVSSGVSH